MKNLLHYLATGWLCVFVAASSKPGRAQSLQLVGTTASLNDPRGSVDAVAAPGRLYTANFGTSSLSIYDVSQPASPRRVGVVASPGRPRSVVINGNRAYLACYGIGGPSTSDIQAVDISNATTPQQVKRLTLSGGPLGIDTGGSLVCAVSPTGMLYVFDTALTQLSATTVPSPSLVTLNGKYAYVLANTNPSPAALAQLRTYDLSVPTAPVLVSTVTLSAGGSAVGGIRMVLYNGALFVPGTGEVFSLANPAAPVRQAALAYTLDAAAGLLAYGRGVNTVAGKSTVSVYDVHTPFAPILAATALSSTTDAINVVTGFGDYVYALSEAASDFLQVYKYTATPLSTQPLGATIVPALYPNPSAAELVTLTLPAVTQMPISAVVYDGQGRLVQAQVVPVGSTQVQLNLNGTTPGLYIVRCGAIVQKLVRQ